MTDFGKWIRGRRPAWAFMLHQPQVLNPEVVDDLANLAAQQAERLERIRLRVEPGRSSSWTLDDAIKEIGWIDDECRLARKEAEEFQEKYHA